MTDAVKPPRRRPQLHDLGPSQAEASLALARRKPPTEAEIAASIIDEDDLKRLGRWGGEPSPPRGLLGG